MRTLSALAFRRKFGRVLDDVVKKRQPVTVTRANRALVVLVPADDYVGSDASAASRESRLQLAAERLARWRAAHAAQVARLDAVALVRRNRDDR